MGKGRDEDAVRVVHEVAKRNKKTTTLSIEDLKACESIGNSGVNTSNSAAIKRQLEKLQFTHVRALFATKRLAISTGMIMSIWALIGKSHHTIGPMTLPHHSLYSGFKPLPLTDYRPSLSIVQRLYPIHPSHARCRLRRWLDLHHLPELSDHRRSRCSRSHARRLPRRTQPIRPTRQPRRLRRSDRCLSVRVNNIKHL